MRNETETKRNETKQIETKRNKSKRNETNRNETKQIETKRNEINRNETKQMIWQSIVDKKSVFSNIRKSFQVVLEDEDEKRNTGTFFVDCDLYTDFKQQLADAFHSFDSEEKFIFFNE